MKNQPRFLIIAAGGSGSRMGSATPKQLMIWLEKPLIIHAIEPFFRFDERMQCIVALPETQLAAFDKIRQQYFPERSITTVKGGATRFDSVQNALAEINGEGWVAVHDAARPLVSVPLIARCFADAEKYGSSVPAIPVRDTVRETDGRTSRPLLRAALRLVQTPQCFSVTDLKRAYAQPYQEAFTDDAGVAESAGVVIHLTAGEERNLKVTVPEDLALATALYNL